MELTSLAQYLELEPRVQLLEVGLGEVLPQPTDVELAVCKNGVCSSKSGDLFARSCMGDDQHAKDLGPNWVTLDQRVADPASG